MGEINCWNFKLTSTAAIISVKTVWTDGTNSFFFSLGSVTNWLDRRNNTRTRICKVGKSMFIWCVGTIWCNKVVDTASRRLSWAELVRDESPTAAPRRRDGRRRHYAGPAVIILDFGYLVARFSLVLWVVPDGCLCLWIWAYTRLSMCLQ